ncbi:hypothetical protein [Pseudomonas sp. SCB32]|nr:hypothetical protein [Pseudomonas sp. SCB32]
MSDVTEKKCPRCDWWLPADLGFYSADKSEPDGLHPICWGCLKQLDEVQA